jgi:hypothetical protein
MATTAKIAKEVKKLAEIAARQKTAEQGEVSYPAAKPLQELRAASRLPAQVFFVPYLLPQVCSRRRSARCDEGELVSRNSQPGVEHRSLAAAKQQ